MRLSSLLHLGLQLASEIIDLRNLCGSLSGAKAHQLGSAVVSACLEHSNLKGEDVNEVILGQVLTAGEGQNPARQASVAAGIPFSVPAHNINMLCGSGLKAVIHGCQSIKCGDSCISVCGGQESMTNAPHCLMMRKGTKFGDLSLTDTMICDGLTDAFHKYHMGITAENVANEYQVSREQQDKFAALSQNRAECAQKNNWFSNEIVPVKVKNGKIESIIDNDEFPRHGTTFEKLSKLNPAFVKNAEGTVTAGNASGINDGAAAMILMSLDEAKSRKLPILAKVVSYSECGVDPSVMGTGPIPAIKLALSKANWEITSVDLFEINEAFASQSIAVCNSLNISTEKVNINGGGIALGHPIGASGARILVTLIHALRRIKKCRGVAALCVGGGMGLAICIEVPTD